MAIAGGAIIPWIFAILKQHIDFQLAYVALAVPSYVYLLFFGLRGHRV
jgi:fucose permease